MHHKSHKKYIISDTLSHLASANTPHLDPYYLELDVLFTYNTTLVKIDPSFMSQILAG